MDNKHEYKIQIDKDIYSVDHPILTGDELLKIANKEPVERFAIYLKIKEGSPQRIGADEKVDLRNPGVERFVTLPLDQTEGFDDRREFTLPQGDLDWLCNTGLSYELVSEKNVLRVVLYGFPLPLGYNHNEVDVNVRIDPGYPDTQIDMVYVYPPIALADGRPLNALSQDQFDGKIWQRWSRHRTPANPWRPGIDNLSTHFGLIEEWFSREPRKA
ncbi:MAG: multiubiquitin domain-containing protein [Nitrospinae bacterium]|nr:multiubiquitin domain-containing protein [Nitrospinota bacterium]